MYHVRVSMAVRIELFNARVIYHSLDSNRAGSVLIAASKEIVGADSVCRVMTGHGLFYGDDHLLLKTHLAVTSSRGVPSLP